MRGFPDAPAAEVKETGKNENNDKGNDQGKKIIRHVFTRQNRRNEYFPVQHRDCPAFLQLPLPSWVDHTCNS